MLISLPSGLGFAPDWISNLVFPALLLPPVAVAVAVLRYRLYDLDLIISRTLTWALLTVRLGLGYAAVVLGLSRLAGQGSSLVVAAATLAVVAAFSPLRRRVQQVVDRRFNRRRYDAAGTVEAFAARLRDQVDLNALHGELLAVVDQTMQPTRASLWLRHAPEGGVPVVGALRYARARRRVQQAMDRRFNRRRHDAAQTITAFSDRLHQQIDLDTLSAELLAVVHQTMQPTQALLWLRPSQPASSPAGGPTAHP